MQTVLLVAELIIAVALIIFVLLQRSEGGGLGMGSSSGGGNGTCKHADCSTGAKLTKTCNTCTSEICSADPYCCAVTWDSICVGEAGSICGETRWVHLHHIIHKEHGGKDVADNLTTLCSAHHRLWHRREDSA